MKLTNLSLVLITLALSSCGVFRTAKKPVDLSRLRDWDIVVTENALPSEKYAAKELQGIYEKASGHRLEIKNAIAKDKRHILIGPGAAASAQTCYINPESFGPEDLRIVANDWEIVITGGRPRGTLYGVYTFCEKALGVRFLTKDHTHIPKLPPEKSFGPLDFTYSPPIKLRYTYYGEIHEDNHFAARMRQNAARIKEPELGGHTSKQVFNHTVSGLLPWSKYGKSHPEYFCLRDGKRPTDIKRHQTYSIQPCFSNPEVRQIITSNLLERIKKNYPKIKEFSVSQADNYSYCQCEACAAKDKEAGCHTGQLLDFVNAVAEEVEKKYPDVTIGTLIYQWSRTPPKNMRPRHNVKLQLCSIECCQLHAIDDPNCPLNKPFQRDLAGWAKLTDNIAIWNYNVNFRNYLVPCPNLFNLTRNVRYFVNNNVNSIFMQCAGGTTGAEFSDLRNYIICNLLWDPSRDGEELMDEFLQLHYGKAAEPIRRFINQVNTQAQKSGKHHHCFGSARDYGLDAELGRQGIKEFDLALKMAENEEIRNRVEKLSITAWRLALEPLAIAIIDGKPLSKKQKEDLRPIAEKFFELCRKHKVRLVTERVKTEDAEQAVFAMLDVKAGPATKADPVKPLGEAIQSILDLYQNPEKAFSLTIDLSAVKNGRPQPQAQVQITRVAPDQFRLVIQNKNNSMILQRDEKTCFVHFPRRNKLIIGHGPLAKGTTRFDLESVLREISKSNRRIAVASQVAKSITGQTALLLPHSAGFPVCPGPVKKGIQEFSLKSGGKDLASFFVNLQTGQFDHIVYNDPNGALSAKLSLKNDVAGLPETPDGVRTPITLPREKLEAGLVRIAVDFLLEHDGSRSRPPLNTNSVTKQELFDKFIDYFLEKLIK